jgi:hypothetical protein
MLFFNVVKSSFFVVAKTKLWVPQTLSHYTAYVEQGNRKLSYAVEEIVIPEYSIHTTGILTKPSNHQHLGILLCFVLLMLSMTMMKPMFKEKP